MDSRATDDIIPSMLQVSPVDRGDSAYAQHFEELGPNLIARATAGNVFASNRSSTYLYRCRNGNRVQRHVIWFLNNPEDIIPVYRAIPAESLESFDLSDRDIEEVNRYLLEALAEALAFYKWSYCPAGFVIEGSDSFGLEAGNFLGIRINFFELVPLLNAIKTNDASAIERESRFFTSGVVHEMVHRERGEIMSTESSEIPSHLVQLLFDPSGNELFIAQMKASLQKIRRSLDATDECKIGIYDKAQFHAVLIVADFLSRQDEDFAQIMSSDQSLHKLEALMQALDYVGSCSMSWQDLIRDVIETGSTELLERAIQLNKSFGQGQIVHNL